MNDIELLQIYREQLTAQTVNTELPEHDRNSGATVLAASRHLTSARLNPKEV